MIKRVVIGILFAALALYVGDAVALRFRSDPYGQVTVQKVYALHKRRDKADYVMAPPEDQQCAHALFPHSGRPPCWYLERHTEQQIDFY